MPSLRMTWPLWIVAIALSDPHAVYLCNAKNCMAVPYYRVDHGVYREQPPRLIPKTRVQRLIESFDGRPPTQNWPWKFECQSGSWAWAQGDCTSRLFVFK